MEEFNKAIQFAAEKHRKQKRKDGRPYIYHPMEVARIVSIEGYGLDYQIVALLHDLIEDTDATQKEVVSLFGEKIGKAVVCLTRGKEEDMDDYVSRVLSDEMATVVKNADIINNLSECVYADDGNGKGRKWLERFYAKFSSHYRGKFSKGVDDSIDNLGQYLNSGLAKESFSFKLPSISDLKLYSENNEKYFELVGTGIFVRVQGEIVCTKRSQVSPWVQSAMSEKAFWNDLEMHPRQLPTT